MTSFKSDELNKILELDNSFSYIFLQIVDLQNLNIVKSNNLELVETISFDYCFVIVVKGKGQEKNEECRIAGILNKDLTKQDNISLNGWKVVINNEWRKCSYNDRGSLYECSFAFSIIDPDKRIAVEREFYIDLFNSRRIQEFLKNIFLPLTGYENYSAKILDDRLISIEKKLDELLKK